MSRLWSLDFTAYADRASSEWSSRAKLLKRSKSSEPLKIHDNLFPKDGSQFRPPQLELLWALFGIPEPCVPEPRFRGHIIEMVDKRNEIAHGLSSADRIGGRFTLAEMEQRINDTEELCAFIAKSMETYASSHDAFL